MKKLLGIVVLSLLWCSTVYSEIIELNECYESPSQKTLRYEQSNWSINTSTSLVTHIEIYQDSFLEWVNNQPGYEFDPVQKETFTDYEIYNYTSGNVIANKYYSDNSLRQLLYNPNGSVVHWQARINFKNNQVKVIMLPKGHEDYDFNKVKRLHRGKYTYTQFTKDFKTRIKIYQCSSTYDSRFKAGSSNDTVNKDESFIKKLLRGIN